MDTFRPPFDAHHLPRPLFLTVPIGICVLGFRAIMPLIRYPKMVHFEPFDSYQEPIVYRWHAYIPKA